MLEKYFQQLGIKYKLTLLILIIFGSFLQGMTMFRSGLNYPFGFGFWGPNGHDGIWHLALINQVLVSFPPPHPTFAGSLLENYHYFYDIMLAIVNKITSIPSINLYFQIFPALTALGLGILSFVVGYLWKKSFWVGFWLAFLNYFAGSFGFLVTFIRSGEIGGESLFYSMQSISTLINPPFAFSLIVILTGMVLLMVYDKNNIVHWVGISLLFGILINIKIYAGIVILSGLFVFSLIKTIRKDNSFIKIFITSFIISLGLYLVTNKSSGNLLSLEPLWFVHSMIESTDRLYLPNWALERYNLMAYGWPAKLIFIEVVSVIIFLVGNLGTRVIGLWSILKSLKTKSLDGFDLMLFTMMFISAAIPLMFVQKGTAWNTIQFFYYFLFFMNFYAAVTLSAWLESKKSTLFKISIIIFFLVMTVPTTYSTIKDYFGYPPPAALPLNEMKALDYLKNLPGKTVLTYPYDPYLENRDILKTPIPLYLYVTSGYVSAFSGKQTYLEDEMNLGNSGYPVDQRKENIYKLFFKASSPEEAKNFLFASKIDYLYLVGKQDINFAPADLGLKIIYDQELVRIFQVL
jgi:hypothetical protein